jgi:protein-disulfide isomerase
MELARRAGTPDMRKFEECNSESKPVPAIEAGIRDAKMVGGSGTPTVIVNGVMYRRGIDSTHVARLVARLRQK